MNTLTIHGANPENLYRAFGLTIPENIIDFSTNANILTWPGISLDIERLASHYPDPECTRLREIVSERERVPKSRILFTNGINQAIFILAGLFANDTAILQPCYPEYRRAFPDARDIFTLEQSGNFRHVIICNPNNPTGKFIPDLSRIIVSKPHTTFIIDEAYIDFLLYREPERLCDFPNVIILRSLTKIFHMSGARIGYVIADGGIIAAMKELMPTWSVNAFAQELALRFLADGGFLADFESRIHTHNMNFAQEMPLPDNRSFLERTKAFYRANTPLFMAGLRDAGFDVMDSDVHYFLVRADDDIETVRFLLTKGIAVRHTRNFAGLNGGYVRVATRCPEDNRRLIAAMREYIQE